MSVASVPVDCCARPCMVDDMCNARRRHRVRKTCKKLQCDNCTAYSPRQQEGRRGVPRRCGCWARCSTQTARRRLPSAPGPPCCRRSGDSWCTDLTSCVWSALLFDRLSGVLLHPDGLQSGSNQSAAGMAMCKHRVQSTQLNSRAGKRATSEPAADSSVWQMVYRMFSMSEPLFTGAPDCGTCTMADSVQD
jgi:hypothetical protein